MFVLLTLGVFSKNLSDVINEFIKKAGAWAGAQNWRLAPQWVLALHEQDTASFVRAVSRLQSGIVFSDADDEFLCPSIREDLLSIQFLTLTNLYFLLLKLKESIVIPKLSVAKMLDDELLSLETCTLTFNRLLEADLHKEGMDYAAIAGQYQQRFDMLKEQFQDLFDLFVADIAARKAQFIQTLKDIHFMLDRLDGLVDNQLGFFGQIGRILFNVLDEWHALLPPIGDLIGIEPGKVASTDFINLIMMHDTAIKDASTSELVAFKQRLNTVSDNIKIIRTHLNISHQNTNIAQSRRSVPGFGYMGMLLATGQHPFWQPCVNHQGQSLLTASPYQPN